MKRTSRRRLGWSMLGASLLILCVALPTWAFAAKDLNQVAGWANVLALPVTGLGLLLVLMDRARAGIDGAGIGPSVPEVDSPAAAAVPHQLPLDIATFVGRTTELGQLDRLLELDPGRPRKAAIATVVGTGGVGKTALAVHAAHRLAEKFPGGQLYVNLRGFDPVRLPTPPARALRGFLDALGIASAEMPSDSEAQAGLYRTLLADRRMLVVLDNARDAEQVRLLLPGGGGCLVMITSRDQMAGVVAARGAHPVVLGLLDTDEARALMTRRLGPDRVAAEPEPVAEIINRCHGLPLALAIVAARAVTNRAFPLAALAGQLSVSGELDAFANGDASTDMRAVFSWSYQALGAEAARVFRLLGLLPGPDYTAQAVASIAALPLREARAYLAELARAHLITEQVPGRFVMHDLLHAYAGEVALTEEDEPQRRDAVRRMLDHYLRTGYTAAMLIYPRDPIILVSPLRGVVPEELTDHQQALAWFAAEHPVLLAAVDHAAAAGFDVHTWQLAWTLYSFLDWRGHWPDQAASQRSALQAAVRLDDQVAQARTHINLAQAYGRLRHYHETHRHLRRAVELYTRLGDKTGQARAHLNLCHVLTWEGNHVRALEHGLLALDLHRAAGHRSGEAEALNEVGWCHAMLGQYELTIRYCSEALPLMEETGHRHAVAATWDSLGYAHHHLGEADRAIDCYERTLRLYQDLGDRFRQAETLARLGDAYHALADTAAAVQAWRESVEIFEKFGHQNAQEVRAKLTDVTAS